MVARPYPFLRRNSAWLESYNFMDVPVIMTQSFTVRSVYISYAIFAGKMGSIFLTVTTFNDLIGAVIGRVC